jgi:predicted hydrocarbon binding protein
MEAIDNELLVRGNFFAQPGYLTQDLKRGTIENRSGMRMLALTDDFLLALGNTLEAELGERAGPALKAIGRDWGQQAGQTLASQMEQHFGQKLMEMPLNMFAANVTEAFQHHGWGNFRFDFSRYASGLLTVIVGSPIVGSSVQHATRPVETLLSGFLAGMFSYFSGTDLDCLQTECAARGAAESRFILTLPERLQAVAAWVGEGKAHDQIVHELEQTRV